MTEPKPLIRHWQCHKCRASFVTRLPHDIPLRHEDCGGVIMPNYMLDRLLPSTFEMTPT